MYHEVAPAGGRSGAAWARALSHAVTPLLAGGLALASGAVIAGAAPGGGMAHGHAAHAVPAAVGHLLHADNGNHGGGLHGIKARGTDIPEAFVITPGTGVLAATTAPSPAAPVAARVHARPAASPRWPDVLLVPPSTLPPVVTIVPSSTEGLGATPLFAAGAVSVIVLGTLIGVRIARRPG